MMKSVALLFAVAMLGGCASYSEVKQIAPDYQGNTTKHVQVVADCILLQMVDQQADVHAVKDGDSIVIVAPVQDRGSSIAATVTVSPTAQGTHVAARSPLPFHAVSARRAWSSAQRCM